MRKGVVYTVSGRSSLPGFHSVELVDLYHCPRGSLMIFVGATAHEDFLLSLDPDARPFLHLGWKIKGGQMQVGTRITF